MAAWAADCAAQMLAIFEAAAADDVRVAGAIDLASPSAAGDVAVDVAISSGFRAS